MEIELNEMQKQVILSGILGDGNIKRNGSNCYYRETHGKKELEYCKFKHDLLTPYISKGGFHLTDKRDGQMGFQTVNNPIFKQFKQRTFERVVNELNIFGLLLLLLDDGWTREFAYCLSLGNLEEETRLRLISKYVKEFKLDKDHITYYKHPKKSTNDYITFRKKNWLIMIPYFKQYIPNNIDVFRNKIQPSINKFKV